MRNYKIIISAVAMLVATATIGAVWQETISAESSIRTIQIGIDSQVCETTRATSDHPTNESMAVASSVAVRQVVNGDESEVQAQINSGCVYKWVKRTVWVRKCRWVREENPNGTGSSLVCYPYLDKETQRVRVLDYCPV